MLHVQQIDTFCTAVPGATEIAEIADVSATTPLTYPLNRQPGSPADFVQDAHGCDGRNEEPSFAMPVGATKQVNTEPLAKCPHRRNEATAGRVEDGDMWQRDHLQESCSAVTSASTNKQTSSRARRSLGGSSGRCRKCGKGGVVIASEQSAGRRKSHPAELSADAVPTRRLAYHRAASTREETIIHVTECHESEGLNSAAACAGPAAAEGPPPTKLPIRRRVSPSDGGRVGAVECGVRCWGGGDKLGVSPSSKVENKPMVSTRNTDRRGQAKIKHTPTSGRVKNTGSGLEETGVANGTDSDSKRRDGKARTTCGVNEVDRTNERKNKVGRGKEEAEAEEAQAIPSMFKEKGRRATHRLVWVTPQVYYWKKSGLGFLLSDGSASVLFNDDTKIVLHPAGVAFDYIERSEAVPALPEEGKKTRLPTLPETEAVYAGNRSPSRKRYSLTFYPFFLEQKVRVLKRLRSQYFGDAVDAMGYRSASPSMSRTEASAMQAFVKEDTSNSSRCEQPQKQETIPKAGSRHSQRPLTFVEKCQRTRDMCFFRLSDRTVQVR